MRANKVIMSEFCCWLKQKVKEKRNRNTFQKVLPPGLVWDWQVNDNMCAAEILCVENNFVFAFLCDEWMHALMTGEGGASSGSWARIICKWVQQGGHQRWTICLSTTHHSPCQPCSKSDNLGVVAALFNNGMIANYNPLCINRQTGAVREEEGVVYNASLSLRKRMRTIFHKLWRAEQTIWTGKVRVGLEWLVWEVHLFALCLSATRFSITLCCLVEQKQLKYIINQRWGFVSTVANNGWVTYRSSYKML